eukprot:588912-Amphidinium_carterae.1
MVTQVLENCVSWQVLKIDHEEPGNIEGDASLWRKGSQSMYGSGVSTSLEVAIHNIFAVPEYRLSRFGSPLAPVCVHSALLLVLGDSAGLSDFGMAIQTFSLQMPVPPRTSTGSLEFVFALLRSHPK